MEISNLFMRVCRGVQIGARQTMTTSQYRQMAGRAGRAGYVSAGHVFVVAADERERTSALQIMSSQASR
eukprot:3140167-Pleurochrysis_carterae.AAC.1